MAIRFVVYIEALSGHRDDVIASSAKRGRVVREQPGCQEFETYQSIERPDRFVLLEKWADEQALRAHWATIPNTSGSAPTRQIIEMERYEIPDRPAS